MHKTKKENEILSIQKVNIISPETRANMTIISLWSNFISSLLLLCNVQYSANFISNCNLINKYIYKTLYFLLVIRLETHEKLKILFFFCFLLEVFLGSKRNKFEGLKLFKWIKIFAKIQRLLKFSLTFWIFQNILRSLPTVHNQSLTFCFFFVT